MPKDSVESSRILLDWALNLESIWKSMISQWWKVEVCRIWMPRCDASGLAVTGCDFSELLCNNLCAAQERAEPCRGPGLMLFETWEICASCFACSKHACEGRCKRCFEDAGCCQMVIPNPQLIQCSRFWIVGLKGCHSWQGLCTDGSDYRHNAAHSSAVAWRGGSGVSSLLGSDGRFWWGAPFQKPRLSLQLPSEGFFATHFGVELAAAAAPSYQAASGVQAVESSPAY